MAAQVRALTRLACGAALLALAACVRDARQALPGEWRSGSGRMVFYRDGQLLMEEGDSAASMARYDILGKHRVRIRGLAADPAEYTVVLKADSLILCRADAPSQCYRLARAGTE
jgi:hypothetical protein